MQPPMNPCPTLVKTAASMKQEASPWVWARCYMDALVLAAPRALAGVLCGKVLEMLPELVKLKGKHSNKKKTGEARRASTVASHLAWDATCGADASSRVSGPAAAVRLLLSPGAKISSPERAGKERSCGRQAAGGRPWFGCKMRLAGLTARFGCPDAACSSTNLSPLPLHTSLDCVMLSLRKHHPKSELNFDFQVGIASVEFRFVKSNVENREIAAPRGNKEGGGCEDMMTSVPTAFPP